MSQITWRNVNSDMTPYQGRALEGAGRSFDSMFDKLTGAVARTQAIDDKNWDTTKTNRTNAALNQIMGYASPEAMAEAQKAGALQALMQGGQIDEQAVRNAFDARMPLLQQRGKQAIDYKNTVTDDATAPLLEAARMAAINGDPNAQAMLQNYVAKGGRNGSQGAEFLDGRKQLGVTRERDTTRFGWDGEDQVNQNAAAADALLTNAAQRSNQAAQLGIAQQQLAGSREDRALLRQSRDEDKLFERQAKTRAELGSLYSEDANSPQAGEKYEALIGKTKNEAAQNNQRKALAQMLKDPDAKAGSVLSALATIGENEWTTTTDKTLRNDAIELAKTLQGTTRSKDKDKYSEVRKAELMGLSLRLDLKAAEMAGDVNEVKKIKAIIERSKNKD